MIRRRLALLFALSLPAPALAQTSYPMLSRVEPTAVQRGKSAGLSVVGFGVNGGGDFSGAFAVLCEGPGLKGEVVSADTPDPAKVKARGTKRGSDGRVKVEIEAAADAPLGPREIRVATPRGVSSVGLVVVVDDPVVAEADDARDDEAKGAQALNLPCAVSGTIGKPEDVDWYAFPARGGQRLTFAVWANRLENKIHDLQLHFDPILSFRRRRARTRGRRQPRLRRPAPLLRVQAGRDLLPPGPRHDVRRQHQLDLRAPGDRRAGRDLGLPGSP